MLSLTINRHNFILHVSAAVGTLTVLAAVLLSAGWIMSKKTRLPSKAKTCPARYSLKRLTPCPTESCQSGENQIIYQNEEDIEVGLFLDTGGRTVVAVSTYLNYSPDQFRSFDVSNGNNEFSDPIIDVSEGTAQLHHFSLDGVTGGDVHLATFTLTPQSGVGSFSLSFDYQGCGAKLGSMVVTAEDGNILDDPGITTFVVLPLPTQTPTPIPTATLTPTATPQPTNTPTSTSSPTPTSGKPVNTPTSTPVSPTRTPASTPTTEPTPTPTLGCLNAIDYDCDGKVSAVDYQEWVKMFRNYVVNSAYDNKADLNGDGKISALDFPQFVLLWRASH